MNNWEGAIVFSHVCAPHLHRLPRLHRLSHIGDPFHRFGDDFVNRWERRVHLRRRGPSIARLLLAGLAVFAFVKLISVAMNRRRSTAERAVLCILLLLVGGILMSFRRSAARHRW